MFFFIMVFLKMFSPYCLYNVNKSMKVKMFINIHCMKIRKKSTVLTDEIKDSTTQITYDNQFTILENSMTPLCHMPYDKQMIQKQYWTNTISKELRSRLHNAKTPIRLPKVLSISPAPQINEYRSKDEFNFRPGIDGNPKTLGFFIGDHSKRNIYCVPGTKLVNMKQSHKHIAQIFEIFVRKSKLPVSYDHLDGGFWRGIIVRSNLKGDIMAIVVANPRGYTNEIMLNEQCRFNDFLKNSNINIQSLYFHPSLHTRSTKDSTYILIDGDKYIYENLSGFNFRISPDSFFQINTLAAEVLYDELFKLLNPPKTSTLLDLCSGTGAISIIGSQRVQSCIGIESVAQAVNDAKETAKINNIHNCDFIEGNVEIILKHVLNELSMANDLCSVLNPGRAGVHTRVINAIRKNKLVNNLAYISCKADSPSTIKNFMDLIKDNKHSDPFSLEVIKPVDMFPHTNHCELIFLFKR
ncbi:(Uracil-5)-methyltransferase family,S-adenosyl-L-methionine-dependent methyltransferase [Cinara cedri]|uniref:tRNA (uracil(54)-C(5))-methyltransferase n=1 Tax=Cinara cedri TaxID=506608 RepID=A0A5E4MVZ6_9HEMI|nr:(Uracil-5)-methyltransferase family,S-adenosyl-L-methionine-dependent methyltransferase [Cinara cedri]